MADTSSYLMSDSSSRDSRDVYDISSKNEVLEGNIEFKMVAAERESIEGRQEGKIGG